MVQQSDLHVVTWCKHCPFAFGFNKDLMAVLFSMVQYRYKIIHHGFQQTWFDSCLTQFNSCLAWLIPV
jgi:hypothetical protein